MIELGNSNGIWARHSEAQPLHFNTGPGAGADASNTR